MGRLIHKGFFKEMFRQLMVIGIVAAGILMLGNITSVLQQVLQNVTMMMQSGSEMASPIKIYIYIAGIVLTFSAFGWMNRRSRCDFYHSIPVSRTQMFFSTILAISSWMFIGIIAYSIINVLKNLAFGTPFNYFLYFCVVINMLIAAVEVIAAVSLACAISGNRFVNIAASLVILFMPRLLLSALAWFSSANDPMLVPGAMSIFFDPSYNIIAVPYAINAMFGVGVNYANIWAMLYTCLYTAGLITLGWLAFKARRSEAAGQACVNPIIQAVIRISLGIPLLLIVSLLLSVEDLNGLAIFTAPILVVVSFVIYCLYELISTRSALKMAKSMPLFLVCIAVAVAYIFVPRLIGSYDRSVDLRPDDVKSYSCLQQDDSDIFEMALLGIDLGASYEDVMLPRYSFSDPQSREIIAAAYHRESGNPLTVRIQRNNGRDITRTLYFTDVELRTLQMLREDNKAFADEVYGFPKGKKYYYCGDLPKSMAAVLAKTFEEEYESLSIRERSMISESLLYDSGEGARLNVAGCIGADNYRTVYHIDSFTPKTMSMYLRMVNENSGETAKKQIKEIEDWFRTGGNMREFSITLSGRTEGYFSSWSTVYSDISGYGNDSDDIGKTPAETDPEYLRIISILANAELTDNVDDYVYVTVTGNYLNISGLLSGSIDSVDGFSMAVKLSSEEIAEINSLLNELDRWQ